MKQLGYRIFSNRRLASALRRYIRNSEEPGAQYAAALDRTETYSHQPETMWIREFLQSNGLAVDREWITGET